MRKLVLAFGLMAASVPSLGAAQDADPQMGERLAQMWCESCHLIGTGQTETAFADVPSFIAVAKTLNEARAEQLALWLTQPHGGMPDISLTRPEIADLLAYIETLALKE